MLSFFLRSILFLGKQKHTYSVTMTSSYPIVLIFCCTTAGSIIEPLFCLEGGSTWTLTSDFVIFLAVEGGFLEIIALSFLSTIVIVKIPT